VVNKLITNPNPVCSHTPTRDNIFPQQDSGLCFVGISAEASANLTWRFFEVSRSPSCRWWGATLIRPQPRLRNAFQFIVHQFNHSAFCNRDAEEIIRVLKNLCAPQRYLARQNYCVRHEKQNVEYLSWAVCGKDKRLENEK
jgi:hypothetical protein